jgi:hypothetical protein
VVLALVDAWWTGWLPIYDRGEKLAAALSSPPAPGAPADAAAAAEMCAQMELELGARQGHFIVYWCALFGSVLAPEQVAAFFSAAWPWAPTFPSVRIGVQRLREQGYFGAQ